jgi:hypothetical protein
MKSWYLGLVIWSGLWLTNCRPPEQATAAPLLAPAPTASAPPIQQPTLLSLPTVAPMTPAGMNLIVEGEGYDLRPAFGGGNSGIDIALGYDFSTVSPKITILDWRALPADHAARLAATHPYTGQRAVSHLSDVHDITAPKSIGFAVFNTADVPRVDSQCRKMYPGFEDLRSNARSAILSLVYNRGNSLAGPNRLEMRQLQPLIQAKDYQGIADCLRRMTRVWVGTSIEAGMKNRRYAEAKLALTP